MAPSIAWASGKYSGVGLERAMSNVNAAATDVLLGAGATPASARGLHALCPDDRTWVSVRASPENGNPTLLRLHALMSLQSVDTSVCRRAQFAAHALDDATGREPPWSTSTCWRWAAAGSLSIPC